MIENLAEDSVVEASVLMKTKRNAEELSGGCSLNNHCAMGIYGTRGTRKKGLICLRFHSIYDDIYSRVEVKRFVFSFNLQKLPDEANGLTFNSLHVSD